MLKSTWKWEAEPFKFFTASSLGGKGGGPQEGDDDDKAGSRTLTVEGSTPLLSEAQLHELEQQGLIFKYLVAGLPVPLGLLLPVLRSVAACSSIGGFYRQFPSFVGFCGQEFHYRHIMDPEPARCRRTDGKKWRCSKNVIPGQKYCEKHVYRGRLSSTKPVECLHSPTPDKTSPHDSVKNPESLNSSLMLENHEAPYLDNTNTGPCIVCGNIDAKITGGNCYRNSNTSMNFRAVTGHEVTQTTLIPDAVLHADAASISTLGNRNCNRISIDDCDGKSNCSMYISCENMDRNSKRRFMNNGGSNRFQGLDFSPKSVLQVQGTGAIHNIHQSDLELEPARCRRTDGKKWRCRRDALTNQKYCVAHMHRGAKKHEEASLPPSFPTTAAIASSRGHRIPTQILHKRDSGGSGELSTDLSISVPAIPQLGADDDASSSSSSATTISDTLVAA
ncbi:hypothetical protein Tsubulata_021527 [Turnera subulata]|uniref:Growth-regulating factor n=1 Tax=Turnera subulata TaxID=218843 RepID=A0A9Q0G9E8_9ROSI|nr:hypothetical protein Tsubulata_021527 [Turnera subulata]